MKTVQWVSFCLLFLSLSGYAALAQQRSKKVETFSTVPFDESAAKLPSNYFGHSMSDLWPMLLSRRTKLLKQEYETTEAWAKRIEKVQAEPFWGSLTVFSTLAFKPLDLDSEYDADSATLSLKINLETVSFDFINNKGLSDYDAIALRQTTEQVGSFVGSNSFGVKRKVKAKEQVAQFLLFKAGQIGQANILTIEDVTVQQAKSIRPHLRAIVCGKLKYPYIGADSEKTNATLDEPVQTSALSYYLYFEPLALWFYNSETGEVYYRADLKSGESKK